MDSQLRSIVKTVSWRLVGSFSTFLIAYAMTGSFATAGTIGVSQLIANTILYYFHERIWNRLSWGKQ